MRSNVLWDFDHLNAVILVLHPISQATLVNYYICLEIRQSQYIV
jgi:hypothetical protein